MERRMPDDPAGGSLGGLRQRGNLLILCHCDDELRMFTSCGPLRPLSGSWREQRACHPSHGP